MKNIYLKRSTFCERMHLIERLAIPVRPFGGDFEKTDEYNEASKTWNLVKEALQKKTQ